MPTKFLTVLSTLLQIGISEKEGILSDFCRSISLDLRFGVKIGKLHLNKIVLFSLGKWSEGDFMVKFSMTTVCAISAISMLVISVVASCVPTDNCSRPLPLFSRLIFVLRALRWVACRQSKPPV